MTEITDEFTLRRIKKMVDDLCIDLNGDITQQLADQFCHPKECNLCDGLGWVCENHNSLPQGHSIDCGGAGDPCVCNPDADHRFTEIIAEVD